MLRADLLLLVVSCCSVLPGCAGDGAGGARSETGGAGSGGGAGLGVGGGAGGSRTSGGGTGGAQAGTSAVGGAPGGGSGGTGGAAVAGAGGTSSFGGDGGGGGTAGEGGRAPGGSGGASGGSGASSGAGSGGAGGCDPATSRANRELVGKALDELFVNKDLGAIDRYWADPYLQHNPIATSGVTTFRSVMSSFVTSASFSYQRLRTLGECDLVVVQGRYSSTGVIFDMFRVDDDHIVEHWDSDSNQASPSTGATMVLDGQPTAQNRALVLDLLATVLVAGQTARAADFIAASHIEHRGNGGTGPAAFIAYVTGESVRYGAIHHVIADGNFVFALSEGRLAQNAYGFYDLFRLEGGLVVEHWDSRRAVPSSTASGLPIF